MDGLDLVDCAIEKDEEDRLFLLYAQKFAYMDDKTYIPFDRFFSVKNTGMRKRRKTNEEILNTAMRINSKLDERRKN